MSEERVPAPTASPSATPRRARHLMDPNAPRPVTNRAEEERKLGNVQRWVMSVLAVTTVLHLSLGIVLATEVIDNPQPGAAEGLCVIAGAFGVIAVIIGRVIHRKRVLSWWLLLGLLPMLFGFAYIR